MNTWGLGLELGLELAGTIFLNPNLTLTQTLLRMRRMVLE